MININNNSMSPLDNGPVSHTPVVMAFSDPGNAFLEKVLHPPSGVAGFLGPPDFSNVPFAPAEWRNVNISQAVGNAFIGNPISDLFTSDNYLFLTPSGARVTTIGFSIGGTATTGAPATTTGAVVQDLRNTFINEHYDFTGRWQSDVSSSRMVAGSVTSTLNATAVGNKGFVSTAQFRPVVLFRGPAAAFMRTVDSGTREAFARAHDQFNGATLKKFGATRTLGMSSVGREIMDINTSITFSADTHIQIFQLNGFNELGPVSPGQVLQVSQKSFGEEAKEGTFSVQRYLEMMPKWMDNSDTSTISTLYQCYACHRNTDGSLYFVALLEPSSDPIDIAGATPLLDTVWHEMTWVWTLYSGIARTAVSGVNIESFIANPILKRVHTYQLNPSLRSAFASFVQDPIDPDLRALEHCAICWHHMPDGVPARMNFLGALAGIARGVITSPAVKPFTEKILMVAGKTANKLIGTAGQNFLGSLLGTTKKEAKTATAKREDRAIAQVEGLTLTEADVVRREVQRIMQATALQPRQGRQQQRRMPALPQASLRVMRRPNGMPRKLWTQMQTKNWL